MTHPAIYAITLGVALGAAIFAYFAAAKHRQEHPHHRYDTGDWRYGRSDSESWGGGSRSKSRTGREICSICLETIDKGAGDRLPCEHEFHGKCLVELKKRYNFCPNCRRPF
ncbi:E3 ubiquitin-protein ligase znrf3-like [Bradysia coprophila]|uniref:E3 ubiquitin-protein ligase znrf3-like n=1 Tax=Bradysia coprophila TaxID=38358 RepID=UPI00187DAD70|nr:E3 ubiquitin-protein ligase znrf3-like [Bradysia coprophila]